VADAMIKAMITVPGTTDANMAKTSVTWMRKLLDLTSRRCSKPRGV
jgi:hypothetical protein